MVACLSLLKLIKIQKKGNAILINQLSLLNVDLLELHKKYKYPMPKSDITLESFSSIKIDNRKVLNIT